MVASSEYIEGIIATYARASELNLQTPGRAGMTVALDPDLGRDVVVTGDLHGNRRNFNLIRRVAALDRHPQRHLVLQEVCHGGPTYQENGGCMSHTLLEDAAKMITQHPGRVHFLLGNHELSELTDFPIQKSNRMLNLLFRLGLQQMFGEATERVRDASCGFLQSCPLAVRLPGGVFIAHSVPDNVVARRFDASVFARQPELGEYFGQTAIFDLVWGRDYREENAAAFAELVKARVLINGHEPCAQGFATPNPRQIVLDCSGTPACYVILPLAQEFTQDQIVRRIRKL